MTFPALAAAAPPNVIIIMTDDQGLGDFSFMGNPVLKTPHMDALAKESVRFTDFHVTPMCSPTRGQLLTGMSALRNGVTSVTAGRTFLRPGIPTLAELFSQAGYKTGIFGKWHLGDHYPNRPIDKGFQEAKYHLGWGYLQSSQEFDQPLFDGRYFHNGVEKKFQGHCTDVWFDSAQAWMKERQAKGERFFCYIPTNAPHAPHIDKPEYAEAYKGQGAAQFFGMIAHLDERIGQLERFLVEQKLKENTLVIFMTDNGGTAGVPVFNAGLRAGKTTYYEGGHRVPLWLRWPAGNLGAPRDIDVPTQNLDLLPTLCDFCELKHPERAAADLPYTGLSLAWLIHQDCPLPERTLVVQYGQIPAKDQACVIQGKWRLVHGKELYDVHTDRAQKNDLAKQQPQIVRQLKEKYDQWWKGVEPLVSQFVPITIGSRVQPVVELNSGDWENIYADNSGFIREAVGGPTGGHWNIQVDQPGEYELVLRRWPEITGAKLGEAYVPSAKSPPNKPKIQTRAFPQIQKVTVQVAEQKTTIPADPNQTSATVTMKLPSGQTQLKVWFSDADGKDLCGAFYVTVRKK